jgi:hypothetical protein
MTPDSQQARAGYRQPQFPRRGTSATIRSGALAAQAARTGHWDAVAPPSHGSPRSGADRSGADQPSADQPSADALPQSGADARRARQDASIVGIIPLLAVLVAVVAGVYIAWRQGSAGGGEGGVVSGSALLVAALVRLVVPARLAGLLATRKRATDVLTLTVFGAGLLVAGLVLPR